MNRRYYELFARVESHAHQCGLALDLDCPCDRAILTECGLTPEEALEFLALHDSRNGRTEDDTVRYHPMDRVPR